MRDHGRTWHRCEAEDGEHLQSRCGQRFNVALVLATLPDAPADSACRRCAKAIASDRRHSMRRLGGPKRQNALADPSSGRQPPVASDDQMSPVVMRPWPGLLSANEAARYCGVHRSYWYEMVSSQRAPGPIKVGRRSLWSKDSIDRWIASLESGRGA